MGNKRAASVRHEPSPIDAILRGEKERNQKQIEEREAEKERERPFLELLDATLCFRNWRSELTQELSHEPTVEEIANRLVLLSADLRKVIEEHRFDNFWDFFTANAISDQFSEDNNAARKILRILLTNSVATDWIKVCEATEYESQRAFSMLESELHQWAWEYNRIRKLPETINLDDLCGMLNIMSSEGIHALVRMRPDVREVRERFLKMYPELSFHQHDLRLFANEYDKCQITGDNRSGELTMATLSICLEKCIAEKDASNPALPPRPSIPQNGEGESFPTDPYAALRQLANSVLKGQERAVIEALCDAGGELTIADLAIKGGVEWGDPIRGFTGVQRRLKYKLRRQGWNLIRQSNTAKLKENVVAKDPLKNP